VEQRCAARSIRWTWRSSGDPILRGHRAGSGARHRSLLLTTRWWTSPTRAAGSGVRLLERLTPEPDIAVFLDVSPGIYARKGEYSVAYLARPERAYRRIAPLSVRRRPAQRRPGRPRGTRSSRRSGHVSPHGSTRPSNDTRRSPCDCCWTQGGSRPPARRSIWRLLLALAERYTYWSASPHGSTGGATAAGVFTTAVEAGARASPEGTHGSCVWSASSAAEREWSICFPPRGSTSGRRGDLDLWCRSPSRGSMRSFSRDGAVLRTRDLRDRLAGTALYWLRSPGSPSTCTNGVSDWSVSTTRISGARPPPPPRTRREEFFCAGARGSGHPPGDDPGGGPALLQARDVSRPSHRARPAGSIGATW